MSNKKRKGKAARAARNRRKREKGTEGIRQAAVGYRDTYANNWTYHSESYRSGGHYEWMAGVLHQYDRILEVGTGDGSGTAALFRSGATILSIDNNPSCHDLAEARLQEHGIPLKRERRGTLNPGAKTFNISYRTPQSELIEGQVLLLEGDVGNADELTLNKWLVQLPPFDAIACWNIGTFAARHQSFGGPLRYRLVMQNAIYELADRILRPGGVLHIVDRAPLLPDTKYELEIEGLLECHRDQASVTSLIVDPNSVSRRNCTLNVDDSGIVMRHNGDSGELLDTENELVFWSLLARKP